MAKDVNPSVKEGDNIERALKKYKRKFERTKTLRQLRERKTYAKPCVSNRAARKKAIYVERMKSLSDAE